MRKLKLKLEDLSVTPFVTGEGTTLRGTVEAHESEYDCSGPPTGTDPMRNCMPVHLTDLDTGDPTYAAYCTKAETC